MLQEGSELGQHPHARHAGGRDRRARDDHYVAILLLLRSVLRRHAGSVNTADPPWPIVRDGRLMWRNMRRELITRDELMTQLREQGVLALSDVRAAFVEGDGRISVVTRSDPGEARRQPRRVF